MEVGMRGLFFGMVVVVVCGGRAVADVGPTWQGELQNAEVVVVGRGALAGRVEVTEVMKGVESRRFLEAGVEAGEQVVVLERYQERRVWSGGDIEVGGDPREVAAGVWAYEQMREKRLTGEEAARAAFWEPEGGILDEARLVPGALKDEK
jgi:hypothetical protein